MLKKKKTANAECVPYFLFYLPTKWDNSLIASGQSARVSHFDMDDVKKSEMIF